MSEEKKKKSVRVRDLLPDIWELIRPRRYLLGFGFLLMVVNKICGLVLPMSSKYLIDDVLDKQETRLLAALVGAVVLATLIQGVTSFTLTQLISKAAQRLIAELRCKVQSHIGRLPVTYFDANKSGILVSRIMNDVEGIRNLIGTGLIEFVGGVMTAIFSLAIMIRISALLTGVAATVVLLVAAVLFRVFGYIRPIFRERAKITSDVSGRLTESLGGVRVVKGYHAEKREEEVFFGGVQRLLNNIIRSLTAISVMGMGATVLMGLVGAAVMYLGARQIFAGTLTKGGLVEFVLFLGFMIAPIFQLVNIGTQISEALAGLERTREVMHERPEDQDPRRAATLDGIRGDIIFDNVSFAYEKGKPVLHDVSFETQPGTVTALVGPSGSGKSTIIGLVAAFHTPDTGTIWIDGADLSTVRLDSYRTHLGVVLQESFLFDGTIRENVAFSRPGATEADILDACRIARVDEFAEKFEKGYDTIVGERGVKLSGGQRQRVSIARAILADPKILILDEATSSLDSESEALIQEGLAYLMKGRTTFVIAHRLSTIRRADQILVVEEGRVVERGTHQSLYAARGRYYDLYTKQHGVEANLFLAPGEGEADADAADGASAREGRDANALSDAVRLMRG